MAATPADEQQVVNAYFEAHSETWDEIYVRPDVYSVIHQERRDRALEWIKEADLPPGSRALEVGCGAGLTAVALAQQGFEVEATDPAPRMLESTRQRAHAAGVDGRLHVRQADVHALDYEGETFDLALALGVVPWLHSPLNALQELARVLKPGGHLIVNADNCSRLTNLIDPRYTPAFSPARGAVKGLLASLRLRRGGSSGPSVTAHSCNAFGRLLQSVGLENVKAATIGFGPFTFLGYRVMPQRLGVEVHRYLQGLADRRVPVLRSTGAQYLVLARKTGSRGA